MTQLSKVEAYLEQEILSIYSHLESEKGFGFTLLALYLDKTGDLDWGYSSSRQNQISGIFESSEKKATLLFRQIPETFFTDCDEYGYASPSDLLDYLLTQNCSNIDLFDDLIEDGLELHNLEKNRTHPLCYDA